MSKFGELLEQHAESGDSLLVEVVTERDPESQIEQTFTVIKGKPSSLRFLGELLINFANDEQQGETFFIHPSGPGTKHFTPESNSGFYLSKA